MSTNIYHIPYTYLIGWKNLNLWYYGVEFGSVTKTANPENLWKTYFTSSNEVKIVKDMYGEPDVRGRKRIFTDPNKARKWETKVLQRMHVVNDPKWLNKTDNIAIEAMYGQQNHFYGKKHTKETLEKQKIIKLGKRQSKETVEKRLKTIQSNKENGKIRKLHKKVSYVFTQNRLQQQENRRIEYSVTTPNGCTFKIKGLAKFCRENSLHTGAMCRVASGLLHHYKGWKCEKLNF